MAESTEVREAVRQRYAKLAGFLFLWLIVTDLSGMVLVGRVRGAGTFAETAQRVAASEHLYRLGICLELVEALSVVLLGFALYVTLREVNRRVAQVALCWKLGEAALGGVGIIVALVRLQLYLVAGVALGVQEPLLQLLREAGGATYNVSAIFFSLGSALFFWLFYVSKGIPRWLAGIGLFGSVMVTVLCFANLIFPAYDRVWQAGWVPMAVAEIGTGFWLLLRGVKVREVSGPQP